jgi:hypothetical protein
MAVDRKKLAVIHIVKRELGLSDQEYRAMLKEAAGVESARDLDERGFRRLMRFFAASGYYRSSPQSLTFRQKLYINHLVADLAWDKDHFHNFLNKYYKKQELEQLSRKEASNLIESLKNILLHSQGA